MDLVESARILPQRVSPVATAGIAQLPLLRQRQHFLSHLDRIRQTLDALVLRLATITDEPRHDALVPFGPLAFMPGQLIHTNTIKVQIGAGYIVEYSAKQASQVAQRRLQDIEAQINRLKAEMEPLNKVVDQQLGLPDGFSVNEKNEVVDTDGLACVDIEETEIIEETEKEIRKRNARAIAEQTGTQPLSMNLALFQKLYDELENEEDATPTHDRPQENSAPPTKSEAPEPSDPEAKPIAKKKSVSFDLPQEEPEPSVPTPGRSSVKHVAVKAEVVERPFEPIQPSSNLVNKPTLQQHDELPENDDDDGDDDEFDDLSDLSSDEDITHIDELLLQRELAMEYHRKRFDMLPALNAKYDDVVSLNTSLVPGSQVEASRFAAGPIGNARLIIPGLLQQAQLKPGDVIDDLPLNSRVFTADELLEIDRRAELLGEPSILAKEPTATEKQPHVAKPEPNTPVPEPDALAPPSKNVVIGDVQEKSPSSQAAAPPSDPPSKPTSKRVSRFKAARAAGEE